MARRTKKQQLPLSAVKETKEDDDEAEFFQDEGVDEDDSSFVVRDEPLPPPGGQKSSTAPTPPELELGARRKNERAFSSSRFSSTPEESLETARILQTARAARALPLEEKKVRNKALDQLDALSHEEKLRMFRRVHAAKSKIAAKVAEVVEEETVETARSGGTPRTPREEVERAAEVGGQALRDVLAAERAEEALKRALIEKTRAEAAAKAEMKAKGSVFKLGFLR